MPDFAGESTVTEYLVSFGLTRQEAVIYETLLKHGEMTGYEVSKETGISRSNVYTSISGLTTKGAAYLIKGEVSKYTPAAVSDFVENTLEAMRKRGEYLKENAPVLEVRSEGYITIQGAEHIKNKIKQMFNDAELRLYLMAPSNIIRPYMEKLIELKKAGKRVVILTDSKDRELLAQLGGTELYLTETDAGQIRLITDSAYVLTGDLTDSDNDTCLFSGEKNLVSVMKEALKNKIIIIRDKRV